MFDVISLRRSKTDGGHDRMAVEEIGAALIRDQGARNSGIFSFRLDAKQRIQIPGFKADFCAGKIFEVFRRELGIQPLALEEGDEVGMAGL